MQKLLKIYWVTLALICLQMLCGCSSSDNEEQPTQPHDITGVWLEYAYLCSDGYFVDISDTGWFKRVTVETIDEIEKYM